MSNMQYDVSLGFFAINANSSPSQRNKLSIVSVIDVTSSDSNEHKELKLQNMGDYDLLTVQAGTVTKIKVAAKTNDNKPLSLGTADKPQGFVLTIAGQAGSNARTKGLQFVGDSAERNINWPNEGRWLVSENEINEDIEDPAQQFEMKPLHIKAWD